MDNSHYREMTTRPVPGLILSLAAPTILSMLVTSFYNLGDTFFVSRISTQATAAVGVSFLTLTVVLLVVYLAADTGFLEFGCSMIAAFLLLWAVEAIRAWRAANGRPRV